VDRRIGDHVLVALLSDRRGGDERGEIDLEASGRVEVPPAADQRMDLAEPAAVLLGDHDARAPPGMEEGLLPRNDFDLQAELARERLEHPLERVELRTHRIASPVAGP
jgi:hypothetical protein